MHITYHTNTPQQCTLYSIHITPLTCTPQFNTHHNTTRTLVHIIAILYTTQQYNATPYCNIRCNTHCTTISLSVPHHQHIQTNTSQSYITYHNIILYHTTHVHICPHNTTQPTTIHETQHQTNTHPQTCITLQPNAPTHRQSSIHMTNQTTYTKQVQIHAL